MLAAHPAQPARLLEAEAAVQRDRGVAAGIGDDRDDLPGAGLLARAQQRAEQGAAEPAAGAGGGYIWPVRAGETYTVSSTVWR